MSGAIPPITNTPSWSGAQLKHRDNFTFTLLLQSGFNMALTFITQYMCGVQWQVLVPLSDAHQYSYCRGVNPHELPMLPHSL
jgi:hypothetical protein